MALRDGFRLGGSNGNPFAILGHVTRAMREAGCSDDDVAAYMKEATSGDYDELLRVTMQTVEVLQ